MPVAPKGLQLAMHGIAAQADTAAAAASELQDDKCSDPLAQVQAMQAGAATPAPAQRTETLLDDRASWRDAAFPADEEPLNQEESAMHAVACLGDLIALAQ